MSFNIWGKDPKAKGKPHAYAYHVSAEDLDYFHDAALAEGWKDLTITPWNPHDTISTEPADVPPLKITLKGSQSRKRKGNKESHGSAKALSE